MITVILLIFISILGLIFSLTREGLFQKILTGGLCFSILLTLISDNSILLISIFILLCTSIALTIYSLITKDLLKIERLTIGSAGLILTLGTLAKILHYPGQTELRLALIIPIILFILTTIRHKLKQPKEFGFMLILMCISLIQLMKMIIK